MPFNRDRLIAELMKHPNVAVGDDGGDFVVGVELSSYSTEDETDVPYINLEFSDED